MLAVAVTLFVVLGFQSGPTANPSLLAFLGAGDGTAAAGEFSKLVERPDSVPSWPFRGASRLGLARAHVLAGDEAAARIAYQDLLEQWANADEALPVVQEARAEYEALKGAGG